MGKKTKRGGGLIVALTFASLLFNHPQNEWIVVLCVAQGLSLLYEFSDYPRAGERTFQVVVRWVFLIISCASLPAAWGSYWWQRIAVTPEQVSFQGYPDETFNFSVRNGRSYDVYDVQIPFLIGYARHLDAKLSAKVEGESEPSSAIHVLYNYCYGTKGDGIGSHVMPNEREVLIVRVAHLVPAASENFTVTYTGGEKFVAKLLEAPTFAEEPTSYSPTQTTVGVRGDYRVCKFAMHADQPQPSLGVQ